jgi:hypothetical protein
MVLRFLILLLLIQQTAVHFLNSRLLFISYVLLSVVVVLVIVTLSFLPLSSATNIRTKIAPPTIQTHGCTYHDCVSVVVVVTDEEDWLSCAKTYTVLLKNRNIVRTMFDTTVLIRCFIIAVLI